MRSISSGARNQRQYPPQRISQTRQVGHRSAGTAIDFPAATYLDGDKAQAHMMATRVLAPPFWPSWSCLDREGLFVQLSAPIVRRAAHAASHLSPMMAMPITVNGINSVRLVLTETGENGSIQRQLITPSTTG
jgi:hypothetical protein